MEEIAFSNIHIIAIDSLDVKESDVHQLKLIGEIYIKFLQTDKERLRLTLPIYSEKLIDNVTNYLKRINLIYTLRHSFQVTDFSNKCIFNYFTYKKNKHLPHNDYQLSFIGKKNNTLKWEQSTITKLDEFLPVFNTNQFQEFQQLDTIYNTFPVFKSIKKSKLINSPIEIDLEECLLTVKRGDIHDQSIIGSHDINQLSSDSDEVISNKADELEKYDFKVKALVRYPYHNNIHNFLSQEYTKLFEVCFNSRFVYNEEQLEQFDISLLPSELSYDKSQTVISIEDYYDIVNTNHNPDLYNLFKTFKREWRSCDFNIYKTPFPKYLFAFINPNKSIDEWKALFEKNYPAVAQKPIMNIVNKIIEELYDLDWVGCFFRERKSEKIIFEFPNLKGNKFKRLADAYSSFKNYVQDLNYTRSQSKEVCYQLNSFDLIDIVNKLQNSKNLNSIKYVVPDFIFYSYNNWIVYQTYKYQIGVLNSEIRKSLFFNNDDYSTKLSTLKQWTIEKHKEYTKRYNVKKDLIVVDDEMPDDEDISIEDLEFNNEEENSVQLKEISDQVVSFYEIETSSNETYNIKADEKVYALRNTLVFINPEQISRGDLFFSMKDVMTLIEKSDFYDRLSNIPEEVLDFQYKLYSVSDAYNKLNARGLIYKAGSHYFTENYCIAKNDFKSDLFKIPRKKEYWKIICEFLGLESSVMNLAFVSYYGRSKRNLIKEMYNKTFKCLIANNSFGESNNPKIIQEISSIVDQYKDTVFSDVKDFDIQETSESILEIINNELLEILKEVKNIKPIKDE
jgi:hypothetical protein